MGYHLGRCSRARLYDNGACRVSEIGDCTRGTRVPNVTDVLAFFLIPIGLDVCHNPRELSTYLSFCYLGNTRNDLMNGVTICKGTRIIRADDPAPYGLPCWLCAERTLREID
jgi:hypothetical protein